VIAISLPVFALSHLTKQVIPSGEGAPFSLAMYSNRIVVIRLRQSMEDKCYSWDARPRRFLKGQPEWESGHMGGPQWPSVLNMQTFVCVTRRR